MSKDSRRKRTMRLHGETRIKSVKLKGLSSRVTPRFRISESAATFFEGGRDPTSLIAEYDPWLGRMGLSDENLGNAGSGLQMIKESIYGPRTYRDEAGPARSEDKIAGVELGTRDVQSRTGDNTSLDEKGTAQSEPADDQG